MVECIDEPPDHGKHMSSEQAFDVHGSGARATPKHYQLVLNQCRSDGLWVKGKGGVWSGGGEKGKPILGFLLRFF